jgi:LPXTG-motif cell wall-anchored protein
MKRTATIMMTVAMLAVAVPAAAAPALAQAADQYGVQETDLVARLTVECPENQPRVIGYRLVTTGVESLTSVALPDDDGDGVLTGTQTFPRFPPGGGAEPITVDDVRIVAPDGSTVEQFGPVTLDRDEIVLATSVSLCDGGGAGSDQYGSGAVGSPVPEDGGGPAELPETGGASLAMALGAGALLVGGGLLMRRVCRW